MSHELSSGELHVLNKLASLAVRFGLSPTTADIALTYFVNDDGNDCYYSLGFVNGGTDTPEEEASLEKMLSLLGIDEVKNRRANSLKEVEAIVDRALSQAPRPRYR